MEKALYMMVDTGSVDTYDGWIDSCGEDESAEKDLTAQQIVSGLIDDGLLVEVVRDIDGAWIEAE